MTTRHDIHQIPGDPKPGTTELVERMAVQLTGLDETGRKELADQLADEVRECTRTFVSVLREDFWMEAPS
jgi:hypothetical protein